MYSYYKFSQINVFESETKIVSSILHFFPFLSHVFHCAVLSNKQTMLILSEDPYSFSTVIGTCENTSALLTGGL